MTATPNTTIVDRYDVVIIGGGIAGIAIAEFLSRLTDLKILVLEKAEQLGMGASGHLEGWYHTGALYAGLQDPQTLLNCINSLEDLYNFYRSHKHFNGELKEVNGSFVPRVKRNYDPLLERWFNPHPVYYIMPMQGAPDFERTARRPLNRFPLWQQQRALMMQRLKYCFIEHNWRGEDGYCQAPTAQKVEESWTATEKELPMDSLGVFTPKREDQERLEKFCRHYSQHKKGFSYHFFRSLDCSMNPYRIMKDLVASALASGRVDFETCVELEEVIAENQRKAKSIVYKKNSQTRVHIKADLFVLAAGAGMQELARDGLFPLHKQVKTVQSAMVVVTPGLSKLNFARMALDPDYHFNHFYLEFYHHDFKHSFSVLADSCYVEGREDSSSQSAEHILEQAEWYFGRDELYRRNVYEYGCLKTEFIPDDKEERRYSYWIDHETGDNYVYVLPGKFSLFPSVAFQTYRKIYEKRIFADRQAHWTTPGEVKEYAKKHIVSIPFSSEQEANRLVALPYPRSVILSDPRSATESVRRINTSAA